LCNHWSSQGHALSVVSFEAADAKPFHELRPEIQLYGLDAVSGGSASPAKTNATRIIRLRKLLKKLRPDVMVAFMTDANVIAICAAFGLSIPVVISERNQPDRPGLGTPHRWARTIAYRGAEVIVAQTEQIAQWMRARFQAPVVVIPNPVLLQADRAKHLDTVPGEFKRQLVSVGRLTRQKGYDILINSFAMLAAQHTNWNLVIYGEGPERSNLQHLIQENRLLNRVQLPGIRIGVSEALAEADLFVLPSRYEGYPNALLEALACGLPVIATDCPGASAEILGKGRHGILVPVEDVSALANAMNAMMSSPDLRQGYAVAARRAVAGLDITTIGGKWLEQLEAAIRVKNRGSGKTDVGAARSDESMNS
jgi:glycosyltransferase involved in cell wall biosynthesis